MNLKSLSRVADAVENTWDEVIAGINGTEIGVVNSDRTKFRPYVGGHVMDGYDFEESYGEYPYRKGKYAKKGIAEVASKWGVKPSDIKVGSNDEWEGGYLYVPSKELGAEVSVNPEWFEYGDEDEGEDPDKLYLAYDLDYDDFYDNLPKDEYWWWPEVNDQ